MGDMSSLEHLKKANSELELWLEDSKDVLLKLRKERILEHQRIEAQIKGMIEKKEKLVATKTDYTEDQKNEIARLSEAIHQLSIATEEQSHAADEQKENLRKNQNFNNIKTDDIILKEVSINKRFQKLEKGLKNFEEYLGLKVYRHPDSHLQFIFTHIDDGDPEREFSFNLNIEGTPGIYKVTNCSEITELEEYLKELNESNNLKRFLCKMRKSFKRKI